MNDETLPDVNNSKRDSATIEELMKRFTHPNTFNSTEVIYQKADCDLLIWPAEIEDESALIELIAAYRVTLSRFQGRPKSPNPGEAEQELAGYSTPNYHIFVAQCEVDLLAGYLVCQVEGDVLRASTLYVTPDYRRQGIGSALYEAAEALAEQVGAATVSNWIHPKNDRAIAFLRSRQYTVLGLIEVRRFRSGEVPTKRVTVGKNYFESSC